MRTQVGHISPLMTICSGIFVRPESGPPVSISKSDAVWRCYCMENSRDDPIGNTQCLCGQCFAWGVTVLLFNILCAAVLCVVCETCCVYLDICTCLFQPICNNVLSSKPKPRIWTCPQSVQEDSVRRTLS